MNIPALMGTHCPAVGNVIVGCYQPPRTHLPTTAVMAWAVGTVMLPCTGGVVERGSCPCRCREIMAHTRQSRPCSGIGFQVKALEPLKLFALCPESVRTSFWMTERDFSVCLAHEVNAFEDFHLKIGSGRG